MSIDTKAGSNHVDAISMVANQLNVDLSATIKPQANIDVTKPFNVADHSTSVQSSLDESAKKAGDVSKIEMSLQAALQEQGPAQNNLGTERAGGMPRAVGIGLMAGLGFVMPAAGAVIAGVEAVRFAASPALGVHVHAAEAGPGAPSSFKSLVSKSDKADEPSVYNDAMGGAWDFTTGFAANQTRQPQQVSALNTKELKMASRNTIDKLGADAVREDLGQIQETKKRLGQQSQAALDESEEIYGIKPKMSNQIAPPVPGMRGPFG